MSPKRIVKNVVAVLVLAALLSLVGVGDLWKALSSLTPEAVLYLMGLGFLLIYVSVLKWNLFLECLSQRVATLHLFNLYLRGYFVNLILPSYLGGDAVRSFIIGKKVGQHEAAAATILERFTGIVAMLILALIFIWIVPVVTWQIKLAVIGCSASIALLTVVALSPTAIKWMSRWSYVGAITPHFERVRAALRFAGRDKVLLVKAFALSFLFHSLTVVNTLAAAYAVGWYDPPVLDLFVVLPLILLIGALPVSPNGLGIQEGAFYFFLKGIGATPAQALAIGVVLRAKTYLLALLGGVGWLLSKRAGSGSTLVQNGTRNLP